VLARASLTLLALAAAAPALGGCITLSLGTGLAVGPADARDAVTPTFSFGAGFALELPRHVQARERDAPRVLRLGAGVGASLMGVRTAAGASNAMTGPVYVRADATFVRLSERALLRATVLVDGPGASLEHDPQGAVGTYDVPSGTAWSALGGPTLQLVMGDEGSFLFTTGLRVHALSGDPFDASVLFGPELLVSAELDLRALFGGRRR
jgi:hypothetical protein